MPLSEMTNCTGPATARYVDTIASNLKRTWDSDGHDLLPVKLKNKRALVSAAASSSSSPAPSSPFFSGNRLAAYDALSSPNASSKLSISPTRALSQWATPSSPLDHSQTSSAGKTTTLATIDSETSDEPLALRLERGTVMQFGRKAKKPTAIQDHTTLAIRLPPSAKNASRLHCTARILDGEGLVIEVCVLGQNGMKIDGELWRAGSVALLSVEAAQRVQLAFWGWSAVLIVAESEKPIEDVRSTLQKTPVAIRWAPPPTSPTTSTFDSLFDGSDVGDLLSSVPRKSAATITSGAVLHRAASPSLSVESDLSVLSSPGLRSQDEPKDDSATAPAGPSRAAALAASLALDLPGLIASAVAFQPRATVGVEEIVKALLSEVGGMWQVLDGGRGAHDDAAREAAAIEAWWDVVEGVLTNEEFFGCIENVGLRDATGTPLLPAYYYIPDKDPSASRVEALEPFVKRVRGARTAGGGKRYFWRRPTLKKNR